MKVANLIPKDNLDEAIALMELQDALDGLIDENVDEMAARICNTPLIFSSDGIKRIVQNVFRVCVYNRTGVKSIVNLVANLINRQTAGNCLGELKDGILCGNIQGNRWYRSFLMHCIAAKIVTTDEFKTWIHSIQPGGTLMLLFCWYAPCIENFSRKNLRTLLRMGREKHAEGVLSQEVSDFIVKFAEMKADDWKIHRDHFAFGYPAESAPTFIKMDDVGLLRRYASSKGCHRDGVIDNISMLDRRRGDDMLCMDEIGFVVDERVEISVFEGIEILRHRPTLLQFAAYHRAVKCFVYLLRAGADSKAQDDCERTVTQFAVAGGSKAIIEFCITEGFSFIGTPRMAVQCLRFDILQYLLEKKLIGLIPTAENFRHEKATVLHWAAMYNDMRVLLYCLEDGVDVNVRDINGASAVHYAACHGRLDSLLALRAVYGVDINARDLRGFTPAHYAAKGRQFDAMRILVTCAGLTINVASTNGKSPLGIAAKSGRRELVSLILANGGMVNYRTDGLAPLHIAAKYNCSEVVTVLIDHPDVDINIRDMVCFLFLASPFVLMTGHPYISQLLQGTCILLKYFHGTTGSRCRR